MSTELKFNGVTVKTPKELTLTPQGEMQMEKW